MAFDFRDYLPLARTLDSMATEAARRSAVSRAYYAAFCHARDYAARHLGFTPSYDVNDHWRLREHLRSRHETKRTGIASGLDSLRTWRNECDYDAQVSNLASQVTDAIRVAQQIIAEL